MTTPRDRTAGIKAAHYLCAALGLAGSILVVGGLPGTGTTEWPVTVVAPGAALMAAALAGFVALRGVQTWRDKQAEHAASATRENRSRVYEQVLAHMIRSFSGGGQASDEAVVRAMAASWASAQTLEALADWFRYARRETESNLSPNKAHSFEILGRVVQGMRQDIDPDTSVSKDNVLGMIFNDYDAVHHNPPNVSHIRVLPSGAITGG